MLELRAPPQAFAHVLRSAREFLTIPRHPRDWEAGVEKGPHTMGFLQDVCKAVGQETFEAVMADLEVSRSVAIGFGPGTGYSKHHRCQHCRRLCILRTACLWCGTAFSVDEYLGPVVSKLRLHDRYTGDGRGQESDGEAGSSSDSGDSSQEVITVSVSGPSQPPCSRRQAVTRALDSFHKQVQEVMGSFEMRQKYGGSILFLARNLAMAATLDFQPKTQAILRDAAGSWMANNCEVLLEKPEGVAPYLDMLEGMHAVHTLGLFEFDPSQGQGSNGMNGTGSSEGSGDEMNGKPDEPSGERGGGSLASERPRRKLSALRGGGSRVFSLERLKRQWEEAVRGFSEDDVLGFDPRSGSVPMTLRKYCGNCGYDNNKSESEKCERCEFYLRSQVDWGVLTDGIVWLYVARELGIELKMHTGLVTLDDMLPILSKVRDYQAPDDAGLDFFRLQGYFVTHLLYCASDWGAYPLRRELWLEELRFMLDYMWAAIQLNDPELTSEFVQCLKILGVTKETDPGMWVHVEQGMAYLLSQEERLGSQGRFHHRNKRREYQSSPTYDAYHTTYCAAIALMDYRYLTECPRPVPPVPSIFKIHRSEAEHQPRPPFQLFDGAK